MLRTLNLFIYPEIHFECQNYYYQSRFYKLCFYPLPFSYNFHTDFPSFSVSTAALETTLAFS
jgi:hypothetical protein